jgi:hypothetical protein
MLRFIVILLVMFGCSVTKWASEFRTTQMQRCTFEVVMQGVPTIVAEQFCTCSITELEKRFPTLKEQQEVTETLVSPKGQEILSSCSTQVQSQIQGGQ